MRKIIATAFILLLAVSARCQQLVQRMTNQDVISMTALSLSDDVIIAKIRSAVASDRASFDTSVDGLKSLKEGSVSDAVMKVMINPAPAPAPVIVASGAAAVAPDPGLPPPEVGVYWKNGTNFALIQGQMLSQAKVGGRAGAMFTDGMRNLHWDAYVDGPTSRQIVKEHQPVFYFYVPDGSSAEDFVLLRLNRKGNRREFQIGSFGGMNGGKSGIKHDKEISFKADHVAIRTYKVSLAQELPSGEYAFFMGTGQQTMMGQGGRSGKSGAAATGRIYDFSVPE